MGVVKHQKNKTKTEVKKKDIANGKPKNENGKVKKKKLVSCLQCIKPVDDGGLEGKYRVAAPELMQDTFMSDSEDEGGEVECPIQQQQQYRYMNSEAGTLHRAKPLEDSVTDGHLWPSNNDRKVATIERQPLDIGFLVSFVVDARGGAMKAKRRGGVRIIVPPAACAAPTRVTCRAATRRAPAAAPPPLMEGEALASRLLELQPQGAKFLAPVIIEVPIFTSSCREREIVVLRSDTGETWQDHYLHNNDNPMIQEALQRERQEHGNSGETLGENGERVTRIITCDFPHYLAVVSRVRQEVHIIGPEGGTVSSAHIPQVQALFPAAALTKRIRVGLQAHGAGAWARRVLPRHAAASPVITVEPRRRKFHRTITLTVPLPQAQGTHEKPSTSNLRLLCSIMGGQARAVWEDVTGSTPLTITDDCASFTTTVSARFWLMNCQNVSDATKLATELYRDMLLVPFEVRIVVLGKRLDSLEGRLLVMYITDRYAYETLLQQEHYTEVAHSTSVRFLDSKEVYLEFSGNLIPVTKSGSQPMFTFEAFKDNRVEFTVRVKHHEESPSGRVYFMNEPKVPKGEQSQTPTCVLDVELPDRIVPRAGKSQVDYLNLDQSGFDALKDELSFHWGDHNNSLGPASLPYNPDRQVNGHDKIITNGDVKYPTKDTEDKDKDPKPQVNGGTLHVDSNKVKATFDSDEDKTPQNTLEKGKKKPEPGFFGGLADKVKNVFGHSEEKEDIEDAKDEDVKEKESSPKPQPKPRENKEKTPPKPAPRLITEDLLGKVEDMFKDLNKKPPKEDDDLIDNQVYATKLVVDEGEKPNIEGKTEEIYDMYANMQPVDTPSCKKATDPFQFYVGCCEGKYAKGIKHRHEETSNLLDRIEQVNFTAHETIQEVAEKAEHDKEKDDIKQKSTGLIEEVFEKYEKPIVDIKDEEINSKSDLQVLKDAASGKWEEVSDSAHKVQGSIDNKASEIESNVASGIQNVKSSVNDNLDNFVESAGNLRDGLKNKAHEIDFATMEKAEELKNRGHEKLVHFEGEVDSKADDLKHKAHEIGSDIKDKAKDGADALVESIQNVQDNLNHRAQDVKAGAKETVDNVKEATSEELSDLSESIEGAKVKSKKAKKEAKKKAKESKNFFTGLVHNIFGDKDKLEDEVKGKIAETKDSANDLLDQASAKKDEIENNVAKSAESVVTSVQNKKDKVQKAAHDKKDEIEKSVHDKTEEVEKAIEEKSAAVKSAVKDKASEVRDQVNESKDAVVNRTNEIKDAIADRANEAKNAASETASAMKESVHNKVCDITIAVHDTSNDVQDAIHDTTSKVKDSIEQNASEVKDAVQDKVSEVKNVVQDRTSEAKNAVQDKTSEVTGAITNKVSEAKDGIYNKTCEVKDAVHDTASEASRALQEKTEAVGSALQSKKDEVGQAVHNKKDELQSELDRIRHEAELTTDQIKKSAEDTLNAAADKKAELQSNIGNKFDDIKRSGKDGLESIQNSASDKANDLQRSSKQAFDHVQDATLSTFDRVESSAKDKVNDASNNWEDLQSSTRDTYADMKDDLHSVGNSAQDTLHSFQSSAGNTFDSLDDSTREFFSNTEAGSKELFCDVKGSFEGFQVSADNKLEDVKGSAKERLEEAGVRLGETADGVKEGARETEKVVVDAVANEADNFTSSLNDLGNSVFGSSGKGFMKDSSTKLLESEKSQSSPHKKSSGIPKLKRKK